MLLLAAAHCPYKLTFSLYVVSNIIKRFKMKIVDISIDFIFCLVSRMSSHSIIVIKWIRQW